MVVSKIIRKQILTAIGEIGENVATISKIEEKVPFERHTLSKYLYIMRRMGYIDYISIGKAKVWHIVKAPLDAIFSTLPENMSFSEKLLYDLLTNIPISIILIDKNFNIIYMNEESKEKYGNQTGSLFYESIFTYNNPLKLKKIIDILDKKSDMESFSKKDKFGNYLKLRARKLINPNDRISVILIIEDITSTMEKSQKLKITEKFLSITIEKIDHALILADPNNIIIDANAKALRLLEYKSKSGLIGSNMLEYLDDEEIKQKLEDRSNAFKEIEISCSLRKNSGSLLDSRISCTSVNNQGIKKGILYMIKSDQ